MLQAIAAWGGPECPTFDHGVICRLLRAENPVSYYLVLRECRVPAVLTEAMFVTNPGEAACLGSQLLRRRLAEAHCEGIVDFLFSGATGAGLSAVALFHRCS